MKLVEKILLILNELLILILQIFQYLLSVITPRFLRPLIFAPKRILKSLLGRAWRFSLRQIAITVQRLIISGTKFQNRAKDAIEDLGLIFQKERRKNPGFLGILKLLIMIPIKFIVAIFSYVISFVLKVLPVAIFAGLLYLIYYELRLFDPPKDNSERIIASSIHASREGLYRPVYHRKLERTFEFKHLSIPVHIEGRGITKGAYIAADFSVETSNKYSRRFLSENELAIKDHLLSSNEAELPASPLSEEGKLILKEKIRTELDQFLQKSRIEGHILDVYFEYLVIL